jgi:SAM-dependent methyltransferase
MVPPRGGNLYDKYGSRNPVVRRIMAGFLASLDELVALSGATAVHEVGCGEGHLTMRLARQGLAVRGSDIDPGIIEEARRGAAAAGLDIPFAVRSIYELEPPADAAPLVLCAEVLEHLSNPAAALDVLRGVAGPWLLVSVPREPLWRISNLARLRYLAGLGNTPGHIQHWSRRGFVRFVATRFEPVAVRAPFPWTMILARIRPPPGGA